MKQSNHTYNNMFNRQRFFKTMHNISKRKLCDPHNYNYVDKLIRSFTTNYNTVIV